MIEKEDFEDAKVEASRSVLIDVLTVLGSELKTLAIIGGWVPELTFPNQGHIGSIDVDLALDGRLIRPAAYNTIRDKLMKAGYRFKEPEVSNVFVKDVGCGSESIMVKLDLITGEQRRNQLLKAVMNIFTEWK